jgi:hypothetical protein
MHGIPGFLLWSVCVGRSIRCLFLFAHAYIHDTQFMKQSFLLCLFQRLRAFALHAPGGSRNLQPSPIPTHWAPSNNLSRSV